MKLYFDVVGQLDRPFLQPVKQDSVPRVGDLVCVPSLNGRNKQLFVRTVIWYPWGDETEKFEEPTVYIVLGNKRN